MIWIQLLQLWRHPLKRFPLHIDSSRNALYIHRGSKQWKITRFHHPNPWKGLCCLQHAVIGNSELTFAPIYLQDIIALSLSCKTIKSLWTLFVESPRVASSKCHTLNSDWTSPAASSTNRPKRLGPFGSPCWIPVSEANPSSPKNNLVGDELVCHRRL